MGLRVCGLGLRVWGLGFRVSNSRGLLKGIYDGANRVSIRALQGYLKGSIHAPEMVYCCQRCGVFWGFLDGQF